MDDPRTKLKSGFAALLALALAAGASPWTQPRLDSLLAEADRYRGLVGDHSCDLEVATSQGEGLATNRYRVQIHPSPQGRAVLLETTSPASEKGNRILSKGSEMWILTRRTSRPVPVSAHQRLLGDASIGDVLNVELTGRYRGEVEETDHFLSLKLQAILPGELYEVIHLRLEAATARPLEASFHTRSGRLLKTLRYRGFVKSAGRELAADLEIRDGVDTLRRTSIRFARFVHQRFAVGTFDKDNLRTGQGD